LPAELAEWSKEDRTLLGAFFINQVYDFLKTVDLNSVLRIVYSRLNGKFENFGKITFTCFRPEVHQTGRGSIRNKDRKSKHYWKCL